MRTKKEILDDASKAYYPYGFWHNHDAKLIIELLIDIRDILKGGSSNRAS